MFRVGTIPGISGVGECVPAGVGWLSVFVFIFGLWGWVGYAYA